MRRTGVLLLVMGMLAACGDGGSSGESFESLDALAERLGCEGTLEVDDGSDDGEAIDLDLPTFGVAEGECESDGEVLTLSVYPTRDDADQAFRQAETVGCSFASAFGVSEFHMVRGGNWVVALVDGDGGSVEREALESVAERLDDSVQSVECEG